MSPAWSKGDEVYRKYSSFVRKYILQRVPSHTEVEDLTSDVFLRFFLGQCRYTGASDLQAYLCGIAKNVLRERFRSRSSHAGTWDSNDFADSRPSLSEQPACSKAGDSVETSEIHDIAIAAVANLPLKSRQAIELVYIRGLSLPEAATRLGCSGKTLRGRLGYGVTKLRKHLRYVADDPAL